MTKFDEAQEALKNAPRRVLNPRTGRMVTVKVAAPIDPAPAAIPLPAGLSVWCRDCFQPATVAVSRVPFCDAHAEVALEAIGETVR